MRLCSYRRCCTALTPEFYADVRAEVERRLHGGVVRVEPFGPDRFAFGITAQRWMTGSVGSSAA